ncbi:hypothetical protein DL768_002040 [Monosporascus sp. mg162]|nr:hypothetical protein DL768_002040 [Monosporascus sp. mg162]
MARLILSVKQLQGDSGVEGHKTVTTASTSTDTGAGTVDDTAATNFIGTAADTAACTATGTAAAKSTRTSDDTGAAFTGIPIHCAPVTASRDPQSHEYQESRKTFSPSDRHRLAKPRELVLVALDYHDILVQTPDGDIVWGESTKPFPETVVAPKKETWQDHRLRKDGEAIIRWTENETAVFKPSGDRYHTCNAEGYQLKDAYGREAVLAETLRIVGPSMRAEKPRAKRTTASGQGLKESMHSR